MIDQTCSTCKHFKPGPTESAGECHSGPPRIFPATPPMVPRYGQQAEYMSLFPPVPANEHCGSWEERPRVDS